MPPPRSPCLCNTFHNLCSADTCPQASQTRQQAQHTLRAFRLSALGSSTAPPCPTCAAIVAALTGVEEVKLAIKASVDDLVRRGGEPAEGAREDWERVLVELILVDDCLAGVNATRVGNTAADAPVADTAVAGVDESVPGDMMDIDLEIDADQTDRKRPTSHNTSSQTVDCGRRIIRTCAAKDGSENWRHFNLWKEVTEGWDGEGCQAIPPLTCHPVRRTDDDEAAQQLKAWIETCDRRHGCVPSQGSPAPTRLVKVSDNQVRVVENSGEICKYSTLSHRWGPNERFTLVKGNKESMARDIPWNTIPRTYRDAIEVVRKLGIDYIWIDTMCIVQDDSEDWQREAARMKLVYGGSCLTIAAVFSAGSHGGLFASSSLVDDFEMHAVPEEGPTLVRNPVSQQGALRVRQQPHFTHASFGNNYRANTPLLSRGWVLQERVLSPRIVYFDQEELKWECYGSVDCLCGGMLVISNFNMGHRDALGMRKVDRHVRTGHEAQEEKSLPIQWMRIAERYSESALTFDSDRMIALGGIAEQALHTGQGGRYLAGLWERDLAHQICWEVLDTHRRPSMYIAPRWSWLSVFGSLGYSNRMDYERWASVIDVQITQAECTLADGSQETGPVTGGFIKVNGRAVEMDARTSNPGSENKPQIFALTHRGSGATLDYGIEVDYVMTPADASRLDRVLFLYWGEMWPYRKTFLVLRTVVDTQHAHSYERLGIIWYEHESEQEEFQRVLSWCKLREGIIIV